MNEAYAELKKLRHVRVDGNAALEYLAEHVDALVYELQLQKQDITTLSASYAALDQVRRYFQSDYRDKPLDQFRRELNESIATAASNTDKRTAAKVRGLFDDAVASCITSNQLYQTSFEDAQHWLQVSQHARKAAYKYHQHSKQEHPHPI